MKTNMQTEGKQQIGNSLVSVDCVVLGFDGTEMKVLLEKRVIDDNGEIRNDMKLPGDLIYLDENLDDAAKRVLLEHTGLKNIDLYQFKTFGSKDRTKNAIDVRWLENSYQELKVERVVTIGYIALVKIDRAIVNHIERNPNVCLVPVSSVGELAFDHNVIIRDAISDVRRLAEAEPSVLLNILPHKFTALQLRTLYETILGKQLDVRNFQKKVNLMEYVVPLEEREQGVAHRAARYYRFDKKIYNKLRR